jgi:hypothetical protein
MIPSIQEIVYRVYGALLLARFEARGVQYFDESPQAALRSFFVAVLVAPAFLVINLISFARADVMTVEPAPVVLFVFALYYSLLWAAPPVIIHRICQVIDRESAFFRFLSANNWTSVVVLHLQVLVVIVNASGILPEALASLLTLATYAYVLSYQWFITRHCLDVSALSAVGLVVLQFVIWFLISNIATGIIFQPCVPLPAS